MSLTDDWKDGKLAEGMKYFCQTEEGIDVFTFTFLDNETKHCYWCLENEKYCYNNEYHDDKIKVLAPCHYDHLVDFTEKVKKLTLENKHLYDLLANQDKEVERLREEIDSLKHLSKSSCSDEPYCEVVKQLRWLLKELVRTSTNYKGSFDEESLYKNMIINKITEMLK